VLASALYMRGATAQFKLSHNHLRGHSRTLAREALARLYADGSENALDETPIAVGDWTSALKAEVEDAISLFEVGRRPARPVVVARAQHAHVERPGTSWRA
jgi:hypothetical protein